MAKNIGNLKEMFRGSVDPQIIEDVAFACDYNFDLTVENLLQLASSGNPSSSSQQSPQTAGHLPHSNFYSNAVAYRNNSHANSTNTPKSTLSVKAAEFVPKTFSSGNRNHCPTSTKQEINSFAYRAPTRNEFQTLISPQNKNVLPAKNQFNTNNKDKCSREPNNSHSFSTLASSPAMNNFNRLAEGNSHKHGQPKKSTVLSQHGAAGVVGGYVNNNNKVMVLLRGCPGSGKTTLAKQIKFNGVILSTDNYFSCNGQFRYSQALLPEAHEWNREQTRLAMKESKSPLIIDNTNTQVWEMLPYAALANIHGYHVEVIEPDVHWRLKPGQLAKKNLHGVKKEKIEKMLERYEANITGKDLLKMVKGELKDNTMSSAGQGGSQSSHTSQPGKDSWTTMRYGDRGDSDESNCDRGGTDSKDEPKQEYSNVDARYEWGGECTTLVEWMKWGEDKNNGDKAVGNDVHDNGGDKVASKDKECSADLRNVSEITKLQAPVVDDGNSQSEPTNKEDELTDPSTIEPAPLDSIILNEPNNATNVLKLMTNFNGILSTENNVASNYCNKVDKSVGTDTRDMMMIDKLEKENYRGSLEGFCGIKTPSKDSNHKFCKVPLPTLPLKIPVTFSLDKSAQTSDDDMVDAAEKFQILKNCFPMIDSEHLEFLYESCGKDSNSLADILTEFGYHYNDPSAEKKSSKVLSSVTSSREDTEVCSHQEEANAYIPDLPYMTSTNEPELEVGSSVDPLLPLTINRELGEQLLELFGAPLDFKVPKKRDNFVIQMNMELAQIIHRVLTGSTSCLNESTSKLARKSKVQTNMVEEEAQHEMPTLDPSVSFHLSTKIKRKQLEEKFPYINKQILENIFEASGYSLEVTTETIKSSPELVTPPKFCMTEEYATALENDLVKQAIDASLMESSSNTTSEDESDDMELPDPDTMYKEMVGKMNESHRKYKEDIEKAKNDFGLKKFAESNFFSSRAHLWRKRYLEEKQLCTELLSQKMVTESAVCGSVDFHGLKVAEALDLLPQVLSRYQDDLFKKCRKTKYLFLITGRGKHSMNGIPKLKPVVEDYLKKNKYTFSEASPGILKVTLRLK